MLITLTNCEPLARGDFGFRFVKVIAMESRRGAVPEITYPAELPITACKDDLLAAIRDHQVVIVAGETGSGKTTQLPKICLELGRGISGVIGHTQPRRIAARTVAARIAEELGTELGQAVGFKVRFTDKSSDDTLVKLMTDGILLAEIQGDRELRRYDTLIIDEAHERSLNIDFILGYLKALLPRRPDLKVIITSATIDPLRFSAHFDDAPVIEVSGRTYPVEVRYRPYDDDARDEVEAICDAVEELWTEGPGDVLVFLSGEREIRDAADALGRLDLPGTAVLPLYARLSTAEQHKVFEPHTERRVVLATNVAETSLTVPGIAYVVDPGTARISRYSQRTKVQRLPIEPISQASANQRKGRCGRQSDGICIRLYAEDDFAARPEFTEPEILRTNLASVILQMTALGLGDIAKFPFLDPPDQRNVRDGVLLLHELGAIDPNEPDPRKRLTPLGRKLAQLPIDPRIARMVVEAHANGCLREVLVIAAALSIQDPRERPADKAQASDELHARFADETSDFASYLNLWDYLRDQQRALSSSAFRRMCRNEFLHYLRVREWQDLHGQLRTIARSLGLRLGDTPGDRLRIHTSLLAGLLSHVGLKEGDRNEYAGARGARFALWPGSALFKKPPRWVMAAELVETSRLWGRVVARIEPEWIEPLAPHLVLRSYSEPHWDERRGATMAYETVKLYGVPIVTSRRVSYGSVDPAVARDLFIRHALVQGEWRTHHKFWTANQSLLEDLSDLEARTRRRDIVVSDEVLYDFYDERIPAGVVSVRHFDSWWKTQRHADPELLTFTKAMLVDASAARGSEVDYPDVWHQGDLALPVTYTFEPGTDDDGVSVHIPLAALNRVDAAEFDWQVPGVRLDVVTALIRSLPKALRVSFVPAPDFARGALARLTPLAGALPEALAAALTQMTGVVVRAADFDPARVPPHLRMTFVIEAPDGGLLARSRDLLQLREQLRPKLRATVAKAAASIERQGLREWDFGELPQTFESVSGGQRLVGYPALVDETESVAIRVLPSRAEQEREHLAGVRRLLLLNVPSPLKSIVGRLPNKTKLALAHSQYPSVPALLDDCVVCALDGLIAAAGGAPQDAGAFATLLAGVRAGIQDSLLRVVDAAAQILALSDELDRRLRSTVAPALAPAVADMREQQSGLVRAGFVSEVGQQRLGDVLRYLRATSHRLDKLPENPQRDAHSQAVVQQLEREYAELRASLPADRRQDPAALEVRWMLEELRVSLFAQTVKAAYPVSEQRILRAMHKLR